MSRYSLIMATMNVSLPDTMKSFVEDQATERGFSTSSEFVRDLIRHEQDRTRLRALIVDGMASGAGTAMDDDYFAALRERVTGAGTTAS